jgi:hypothetical protein
MTTTVEEMATAFKQMGTPFIVGHPGGESVELMEATKAQGHALYSDETGSGWCDVGGNMGRDYWQSRRMFINPWPWCHKYG